MAIKPTPRIRLSIWAASLIGAGLIGYFIIYRLVKIFIETRYGVSL